MIITIVGSIGAGKSTISKRIFKEHPVYKIVDLDKISAMVFDDTDVQLEIINSFRPNVKMDGELLRVNKKLLTYIVTNDSKKLKILESILHPKIEQVVRYIIDYNEYLIIEHPLFFEKGEYIKDLYPNPIFIDCDVEKRKERIMLRNNFSREVAEKRISLQMSDIEKLQICEDYNIPVISSDIDDDALSLLILKMTYSIS